MGPVSLLLAAASLAVTYFTRRAKDRTILILAWCLFGSLVLSLGIHAFYKALGRATPLMLLDGLALYVTGLMSICRFDGPKWLYALCAAFALQCIAHLAYVSDLVPGRVHILVLNLLFGVELATLVVGSRKEGFRIPARGARRSWARLPLPLALQTG